MPILGTYRFSWLLRIWVVFPLANFHHITTTWTHGISIGYYSEKPTLHIMQCNNVRIKHFQPHILKTHWFFIANVNYFLNFNFNFFGSSPFEILLFFSMIFLISFNDIILCFEGKWNFLNVDAQFCRDLKFFATSIGLKPLRRSWSIE